jgi:hypothetical protein
LEKEFRIKIKENPKDPMNYYYLAKEIMKKPLKDIYSIEEIEKLLKISINLGPQLWAPKISLGELYYKLGRFNEAEPYFQDTLKKIPESESIKTYLAKCISKKGILSGNKELTKNETLYVFENNVREFIRVLLEESFGEEWWRQGIPKKIRATCAARREEALDEEKEVDLLLFADFHDYKLIIESNKNIFANYIDTRIWSNNLNEMEPIRNAIAHNRPLRAAPIKVKEYSITFEKILDKLKNKIYNYFFVTFSSLRAYFEIIKTTKAITIKLIIAPRSDPHFITIGPSVNVAVCHAPPGIKGVMMGITKSSTIDLTSEVAAKPIIKATASPITLYSLRNSLNSFIKDMIIFLLLIIKRIRYKNLIKKRALSGVT